MMIDFSVLDNYYFEISDIFVVKQISLEAILNFKQIEMVGFKSFADSTKIKFEEGINAIVGPNGCGKSNIADAVKWVLGEQSSKNLRGTSMQDVIFKGTEKRKGSSFCEVSLVFDNHNKVFNTPYEEFTVEVNPEDVVSRGQSYVEGLLKLGVNRISMGVQSFDDGILKFMNRRHDSVTARKAYAILESAGVQNVSIDLIFGLPQLSDSQWQDTLDKALGISPSGRLPQHISSYQLSVEPGSMLAKLVERGRLEEASEELCERQYGMLCETLRKAGYSHYEISNFALPGYEARHNSAYWRHVPYVGFGPGSHSFDGTSRKWNEPDLRKYLEDPTGCQDGEKLTREQLVLERIMLALRTADGISESYLQEHCSPDELARALASDNLVPLPDGNVRIPEDRFFVSDRIISDLI